jgi:hypothetical protein
MEGILTNNNPYEGSYLNKDLLHTLNKQVYDSGLITYDIYLKVKADIEKL